MFRRFYNWVVNKLYPPVDFGEYGILMRDPITDELRPMDTDDYMALEQETEYAIGEWWFKQEVEALHKYGSAVLNMH